MKLILVIIVCVSAYSATGQTEGFSPDVLSAIEVMRPSNDEAIRYKFPSVVDSLVNLLLPYSDCKNIIKLYDGDTTTLSFSCYSDSIEYLRNDIGLIALFTNRYYEAGGNRFPIYFSSDLKFGFVSTTYTGGTFRIQFTGRWYEVGQIINLSLPKSIWRELSTNEQTRLLAVGEDFEVILW